MPPVLNEAVPISSGHVFSSLAAHQHTSLHPVKSTLWTIFALVQARK